MAPFIQDPFQLPHPYEADFFLRATLAWRLPPEAFATLEPEFRRFSQRILTEVEALGLAAEAQQPGLTSFDAWGRRVDQIELAPAWLELDRFSAEEGLVAIGYERELGAFSRIHQFAKLYLFNPSSAIYSCPLAMTDGAARLLEVHGDQSLREQAFSRLTSRDPARFWTSGQWMTERPGGSDVGQSETIARQAGEGFQLYGDKWFTSATSSQMAMTLARIQNPDGSQISGSRGLSLFYLETRDPQGALNGIRINRLKEKLGTKALPTAELTLEGTRARLVGPPGRGVPLIASLFNVTRVYNAICSVSFLRRTLMLAGDYARRRSAFGHALRDLPLHKVTLAQWEVQCAGITALAFEVAALLGRVECGAEQSEEQARLRLLTPLAKLFTAKIAVAGVSEMLEAFGGAGYVENTGIPRFLRDCQVLTIWEGTTNVLSLDLLRAIAKDDVLPPFWDWIDGILAETHPETCEIRTRIQQAGVQLRSQTEEWLQMGAESQQASARHVAFNLAKIAIASILLSQTNWAFRHLEQKQAHRLFAICKHWSGNELIPLSLLDKNQVATLSEILGD